MLGHGVAPPPARTDGYDRWRSFSFSGYYLSPAAGPDPHARGEHELNDPPAGGLASGIPSLDDPHPGEIGGAFPPETQPFGQFEHAPIVSGHIAPDLL